jgi:hypothetical protein
MRTTLKGLLLLSILLLTFLVAQPANAMAEGYIDCMNRAITHKYALINDGWSYSDAQAHYLMHTQACYSVYYGGGPYLN